MKRSAIALSASVLALALHAAPAAAQTGDVGQQIGDSTGAAQVGAVQAEVPVRVLSDGNNAEPAAVAAAPQDSGDSTASGQVGSADVSAPVRVASDGDNAGSAGETGGGAEQTADGSTGSAQAEPGNVSAPIRVLSDGDDGVTVAASDTSPSGDPTPGDTAPASGGDPGDTTPAVDELPAIDPVGDAAPEGAEGDTLPDGSELLPVATADVAGDTAAGELPLTGLAVASLVLAGLGLLTGGGALHCLPSRH